MSREVAAPSEPLATGSAVESFRRRFGPGGRSRTVVHGRTARVSSGDIRGLHEGHAGSWMGLGSVSHVLGHARQRGVRRVRKDRLIRTFGHAGLRLHFWGRGVVQTLVVLQKLLLIEIDHGSRTFSVQNSCDVHDPTQRES